MVRAAGVSGPSQAVPWLGRGAQLQTQNKPERDHVPRTEKAKAEHKGVGFLLFFFFPGGIQCDEFSARASATL